MKNDGGLISVARGETPADLLLANARVVNVFTGQVASGNVAIFHGSIAGVGDYGDARKILDLEKRYLAPGFIDGHAHLESSMLSPGEYARAVVPRGTTAIVTDLHEIANVAGIRGLRYVLDSIRNLPFDVFLMAPSCVPATDLETSGATLDAEALRQVLKWKRCVGLGEVMNFPAVLNRDAGVLSKIDLASGLAVDGHAPGVTGRDLNAYVSAGIFSDHESVAAAEAAEKLRLGMHIMIREGSSEKNLEALLPLVTDLTYTRCMFVVDDLTCVDLLRDGDLDALLRKAVRLGLDPVRAIQMVTINPATYFHLQKMGAVAPGYLANLVVLDDLENVNVHSVLHEGKIVAEHGGPLFNARIPKSAIPISNFNVKAFSPEALRVQAENRPQTRTARVNVIQIVPGQVVTNKRLVDLDVVDCAVMSSIDRDVLKVVVVERHKGTGNIGVGFVAGFGLKRGALASSVAHDSHNIVCVGTDDTSIFSAVKEIVRLRGGLAAAEGSQIVASLPLPVAGLLSLESLEDTVNGLARVETAASQFGTKLSSPFATLSFLALAVIPQLRLTDMGLVDVDQFRIIDLQRPPGV